MKTFNRSLDSLDDLFRYLEEFEQSHDVDPATAYAINVAVEELFTNMVKYSPKGAATIPVNLECVDGRVIATLEDAGVEPFDVSTSNQESATQRLADRKPGGQGLYIVHQMVDEVRYEHADGCSRITIIKRLES